MKLDAIIVDSIITRLQNNYISDWMDATYEQDWVELSK